jgi:hypothetical protein
VICTGVSALLQGIEDVASSHGWHRQLFGFYFLALAMPRMLFSVLPDNACSIKGGPVEKGGGVGTSRSRCAHLSLYSGTLGLGQSTQDLEGCFGYNCYIHTLTVRQQGGLSGLRHKVAPMGIFRTDFRESPFLLNRTLTKIAKESNSFVFVYMATHSRSPGHRGYIQHYGPSQKKGNDRNALGGWPRNTAN